MHILIAGGTGFIGQYLTHRFLKAGYQVSIVGRDLAKIKKIFTDSVAAFDWQTFYTQGSDALKDIDLVINLAGAGIAEKRWTHKRKQVLLESRLQTTRTLVRVLSQLGEQSPPLFNASALSVYGDRETLEETYIDYNYYPNFSAEITRLWEQETHFARQKGVRVVNMRFAVVLGKEGGALPPMIKLFEFYLGGRIGSGRQPFSWISIEDLGNAIEFLYQHKEISGPVNFVAPEAVTQFQFASALGKALHRPVYFRMPGPLVEIVFGQMGEELLLEGQKAFPNVLHEQGFEFQHANLDATLKSLVKSK